MRKVIRGDVVHYLCALLASVHTRKRRPVRSLLNSLLHFAVVECAAVVVERSSPLRYVDARSISFTPSLLKIESLMDRVAASKRQGPLGDVIHGPGLGPVQTKWTKATRFFHPAFGLEKQSNVALSMATTQ